jgi:hypothetical protein
MTSNTHKRLDKLQKEITDLGAKGRSFQFIVGDAVESAEAKLERMKAEGQIATGDEYQLIQVPWAISALKGSTYIPEGNPDDPYAEPPLPTEPINNKWAEAREREERWKKHERKTERDGERYEGEKPKDTIWR